MKAYPTDADITARQLAAERKAVLRMHGRCICGPLDGYRGKHGAVHGPVVRGGKCQRCIDQHAKSNRNAR